jgi:high-affinity iron transporter
MLGQLVITLRESLEALLLVMMMAAYLKKTGRDEFLKSVVYGATAALISGMVIAVSVIAVYGGLESDSKKLFEGAASLLAVAVLTYMVYWMATKGREIKHKVEREVESGTALGIATASFIFVVREVVETVLFLTPFAVMDIQGTVLGTFLGVSTAFVISYGAFAIGLSFNLRKFFYYSSILLILIAGGLAGYGVHEFVEYAKDRNVELGWLASYAYDLDIDRNSPLHHKGIAGSIFAVIFGYTAKAEWIRLLVHLTYLAAFLPLVVKTYFRTRTES